MRRLLMRLGQTMIPGISTPDKSPTLSHGFLIITSNQIVVRGFSSKFTCKVLEDLCGSKICHSIINNDPAHAEHMIARIVVVHCAISLYKCEYF